MKSNTYQTREDWLQAAVAYFRPRFAGFEKNPGDRRRRKKDPDAPEKKSECFELPPKEKLHAIVSWAKGGGKKVAGQCFPKTWTQDESTYMLVVPTIEDPVKVLAILVHEMVHALGIMNHGKDFKRVATKLGLEGKMKATVPGEALAKELTKLAEELGPYPHQALIPPPKPEKEGEGRKVRVKLRSPDDADLIVEMTPKRFAEYGAPICPVSNEPMILVED